VGNGRTGPNGDLPVEVPNVGALSFTGTVVSPSGGRGGRQCLESEDLVVLSRTYLLGWGLLILEHIEYLNSIILSGDVRLGHVRVLLLLLLAEDLEFL
jgi:hypothetical protein